MLPMKNSILGLGLGLSLLVAPPLSAASWNQYRGPARHGITSAEGLSASWSAQPPRELWRKPIGAGYSTVAAVGDRLYTMATVGEEEKVLCLDASTGETVWATSVGPSKASDLGDTGPRSTPTVDGDRVYTASSAGRLVALATSDGAEIWSHDFPGDPPRFGYSVSPLVDGDLVLIESGGSGEDPGILAFDKASGELRWSALEGPAGYSSPIVAEIDGVRQYIFYRRVRNEVVSLSTSGEVLWQHPTTALAVITTPVFFPPDRIFVASADDAMGGAMLRVTHDEGAFEVEELWSDRLMRNHFNTSVLVGDHLYGFDNGTFRCLDAETGERRWSKRGFGKGSLLAAGDRLYVLSDGGVLAQVQATPDGFQELGRVTAMKGRAWSSPSLADGRLYVRDFDEIVAFDVSATSDSTGDEGGSR
jgi:outer membrane protein assembly factor BamB